MWVDSSPVAFSFTDEMNVALSSIIPSNSITLSGLTAAAPITVINGEYSVSTDNGNSWSAWSTGTPNTVNNGDQVKVRHTSSGSSSTATDTVLTIGTVSDTFTSTTIAENDGVDPGVEGAAPNSGDGNGDGIPDSQQPNVASLLRAGDGYLTIETNCPTGLSEVQTYTEASQGGGDPLFDLPYGLVGFSAACENATFKIYYHGVSSVVGMTYRKYGPTTPGNAGTMAWYTLPNVTFGTATVGGQTVATATFTLNDNQLGDDTGDDGVIVDQGGPGNGNGAGAAAIPTLSEWGMMLLASLLALGTVFTLHRQRF